MLMSIQFHLGKIPYCRLLAGFSLFTINSIALADFSGSAALTSDYVWRGSSQTLEKPAAQGSFKYSHGSGFYASAWGSNVKFSSDSGAGSEFDLAAGWSGALNDEWQLDTYLLRYVYPGASNELDWNELNAMATWKQTYWLGAGYSNNAMASNESGTYVYAGAKHPLFDHVWLEGQTAHYFVKTASNNGYSHGSFGAIWGFKAPFELRLTGHVTDNQAKQLFGDMAGTRTELAVQASF